nr:hypothetical protein [Tanacetum cinerariifolium]
MSTQSSSNQISLHFSNPEKSLQFRQVEESESDHLFHDRIEDAIVVPATLADQFELKPELIDFIDAINALTKQVEAPEYHFASMRETYDQNQEAVIQLMQNQMGQIAKAFQERPLGKLSSDTETYPRKERKAVTTMSSLTWDGSFIPHSNFLIYQDKEQEPETVTEVVEIPSSKSTPLVPPLETPPLFTPKPKENLEPDPHQPLIP